MTRRSGFSRSLGLRVRLASRFNTATTLAFCCVAGLAFAEEQSANSISREVKDLFEQAGKAVVKIHGADEHADIVGTGFFIDPTGTIYTSYSVGGEADNYTVEFEGKRMPAQQVVADMRSGIAILKVDLTSPA